MNRAVNKVIFDAVIKGKEYKDIVLDYEGEVDDEYIHDEDGPWCMTDLEGEDYVCDFQVYADPDKPKKLLLQCYEMYKDDEGDWCHGDCLYECEGDWSYSNIRVEYVKK